MGEQVRRAVYPGSFDPPTMGHLDIIQRAARLFDELIVAVAVNSQKQSLFSLDERVQMLRECCGHLPNVRIASLEGLLARFAQQVGACAIVRGLRAEVYDKNIHITLICPGFVRTEVSLHALRGDGQEHGQMDETIAKGMPAEVCARHILNALHKRKEEVSIARYEKIALYLKRFTPGLFSKLIRKAKVA